MNMTSVFHLIKRKLFSSHYAYGLQCSIINKRYYSRKRGNYTGTYGPFKIVKADSSCDESGNLNHINNINWELFATNGYPFFMPGNVGPAWQNTETSEYFVQIIATNHQLSKLNAITAGINNQTTVNKNNNTKQHNIKSNKKNNDVIHIAAAAAAAAATTATVAEAEHQQQQLQIKNKLSCIVVNECPMVLRKGVVEMFGNTSGRAVDLKNSVLTVITLIQYPTKKLYNKSKDNQEDVIEKLAKNFVLAAQDICMTLTIMGYWADFINPFSGKPYLCQTSINNSNNNDNTTQLYDTDERFRCLDFEIVQRNNCTIVKNDNQSNYYKYEDDKDCCYNDDKSTDGNGELKCTTVVTTSSTSNNTYTKKLNDNVKLTHENDTFIGNLFTNAPHNIGYLLDIKTEFI